MTIHTILKPFGLALIAVVFTALPVVADTETPRLDEVLLKDGSRVVGTITGSRDDVVTVDTDFAGTLSISMDQIKSLHSADPKTVMLEDDTVLHDVPLVIEDDQLVILDGKTTTQSYALDELKLINPEPWELGNGYKLSGLANLALVMERGNTDSDELDFKVESYWRSTSDRFTFKGSGENDASNGVSKSDNWQVIAKYDYFLTDPNYWGVQVFVEADDFADLDLRYMVGPYYGRQFYDTPALGLSAEVGMGYVNEDFVTAEDRDYAAANWALHGKSNYLGGESRLYLDQQGVWNLDEPSDLILNTTIGLAFPLLWNLEAAAELLLKYDSGAVGAVDEVDQTYKFRLGYTW
jgi:putative salt-induced outer membrane protein YdiY